MGIGTSVFVFLVLVVLVLLFFPVMPEAGGGAVDEAGAVSDADDASEAEVNEG
jgi:hypothetical protein